MSSSLSPKYLMGHPSWPQKTMMFSVCLSLFIVIWSSPGLPQGQSAAEERGATPVRLMTLEIADQITVERRFLGRIEARQAADLAFGFGGTIDRITVQEGARFQESDVLASVNVDALKVRLEALRKRLGAARSQLEIATAEIERVRRLVSRNATPSNRLTEAEIEIQLRVSDVIELEGAVKEIELQIRKSRLIAPFDGIVGARGANLGETVSPGQTVVSIYEDGSTDFRVGLPTTLSPASLTDTRIRINGREFPVKLRAVRPDIDLRTNTQIAIFEVLTSEPIRFGLSAVLIGDVVVPVRGAWVPLDAMRPSAQGFWIVLGVDDKKVARRIAIEVLHFRDDAAFVTGAFEDGARIISVGAHKVVPGQAVQAE